MASTPEPRILIHLITSLDMGGAEMMLYRLLRQMDKSRFENRVVCMIPEGIVGRKIRALGIPVTSLKMRSGQPSLKALFQLIRIIRQEKPNLLLSWMYHADLMGSLAGQMTSVPIIWGIHNTSLDRRFVKRETIRVARWNAILSHWLPRRIIVCSNNARNQHINIGYEDEKFITIPNGYDLELFKTDPSARSALRKELGLERETFLIGLVARFDPLKDHLTFTQAAGLLLDRHPQVHFLLCGRNISWKNATLESWIEAAGHRSNFHLLGQRDDVPHIMNGLDINTLSSSGEAFPNVIGEAMACGVPSVATDVGDTAYLIGDSGITVAPKDQYGLARGWERFLEMDARQRRTLGARARERIQQNFGIAQITRKYENLYEQTCRQGNDLPSDQKGMI
jgi:glycosyltransferase involved in cell wall biosynthesis